MIELRELKTIAPVERFYLAAFPKEEQRELEDMSRLLIEEPRYHIWGIEYNKNIVGLLSYWELDEWVYGEHFAIDALCRGNGMGAEVMRLFSSKYDRIIFEVEPPEEEMACRRIGFYERLGFTLWDMPYLQPPYRAGENPVPLRLMTNGMSPTESIVSEIHRVVYGVL